ncbi:MAG: Asp23/Gls24 family envelope stress response protein [Eubacteriales bacterium]|nr:Asp23/Gls24 family envelope stress response protein [Eubacteriales bacterium]
MAIIFNNDLGDITISQSAIAKIAGAVATNCYGVVGMASRNKKDGFVSLLNVDNITKGVKIESDDEGISIALHIIVEYGVNINAICDSIIHNVSYRIEKAIGTKVKEVTVQVESVRVGQ